MSQNVLRLDNITMQFGGVVAVDNLSLEVNEGEIVALIGPNGAGKTTAFNTITGVYEPTNGQVSFMGEPIVRNHPQGKMKQNYKGKEAGKFVQLPVLDPTPDRITKLGMARTFQNIRLWKSQTVFDNVLIAKHMLRTSNVFSATFRLNRAEEARQREEERAQASQASQPQPFAPASPMQQASKVEKMLIETVIRHGGEVILPDVEDETSGQHFDLNVAQYIAYDLAQDQLAFSDPLYNRILAEAVEQSEKGPFDAGKYFRHHPDIEIRTLAASMSTDAYQLSESLQMKESVERLRDTVVHLVMDFRLDYIEHQLKVLQDRLKKALAIGISTEEMKQMMEEIKNWQTVRNAVARKLGSDIV